MAGRVPLLTAAVFVAAGLAACDAGEDVLAPYEGARPFELLKITQSFAPDIQWVGGRVAAVGVNRGPVAALDSTLVWLRSADGDAIGSHVSVGRDTDAARIRALGGTPADSLADRVEYTFWLATRAAVDAGLGGAGLGPHAFLDTTFVLQYEIRGRLRSGEAVDVQVFRDQKLLEDRLIIAWDPADFPFERIALREDSQPGWDKLAWHVEMPDSVDARFASPVVSSRPPPGTRVVVPWPTEGISAGLSYTLWMTADNWNNTFGLRTNGLAYKTFFTADVLD